MARHTLNQHRAICETCDRQEALIQTPPEHGEVPGNLEGRDARARQ